jgi:hypothetical protein
MRCSRQQRPACCGTSTVTTPSTPARSACAAPRTRTSRQPPAQDRAIVTENVADFSPERDIVLLFVLKKNLPAGRGQAPALAAVLDRWAHDNPDPYLGPHRPRTD